MPEIPPSRPEKKPRNVTLRVKTSAETKRAAARIARDYSGRKLETVLAAFVGDLAVALVGARARCRLAREPRLGVRTEGLNYGDDPRRRA